MQNNQLKMKALATYHTINYKNNKKYTDNQAFMTPILPKGISENTKLKKWHRN